MWTSPNGQYRHQINYILCSGHWRSSIQSAKRRPGADCGSDHELVIVKFYHIRGVTQRVGHNLATKQHTTLEYLYLPYLSCQLPGTSRLFFGGGTLQSMWDLSFQPGTAPTIPAVEAQSFPLYCQGSPQTFLMRSVVVSNVIFFFIVRLDVSNIYKNCRSEPVFSK